MDLWSNGLGWVIHVVLHTIFIHVQWIRSYDFSNVGVGKNVSKFVQKQLCSFSVRLAAFVGCMRAFAQFTIRNSKQVKVNSWGVIALRSNFDDNDGRTTRGPAAARCSVSDRIHAYMYTSRFRYQTKPSCASKTSGTAVVQSGGDVTSETMHALTHPQMLRAKISAHETGLSESKSKIFLRRSQIWMAGTNTKI